jgi:hypothetical protein
VAGDDLGPNIVADTHSAVYELGRYIRRDWVFEVLYAVF